MIVKIRFTDGKRETLENITEVHYAYRPGKVAFESDIDGTGYTYNLAGYTGIGQSHGILEIAEFEVRPR